MGQETLNERKGEVAIAVLAYIFGEMGDPMKLSVLRKNIKGMSDDFKEAGFGDVTEKEIWRCWLEARKGAERLNVPSERKRMGFRNGDD